MSWDPIIFNTGVLIASVFLLDYGADKFIDHTVIVGRSLGVSQTLIALLTAGAEYEELAVVVAALLQHRQPLAMGNLLGSTVSNILGAFSLGLLFDRNPIGFDRSAKFYAAVLLAVTTLFVLLAFLNQLTKPVGGLLIALFACYVISIFYAIYQGFAVAPALSDSDSEADSPPDPEIPVTEETPLIGNGNQSADSPVLCTRSLLYHTTQLLYGLLALSLAGYLLSHSAATITDCLHLSGTVFGLTILSFATTLPEKFIAILSGSRGHVNVMAATAAGSNIFLLTLCAGVVALAGQTSDQLDTFVLFDLVAVWTSSLLFCVVVLLGLGRIAGVLLLVAYLVFLGLEFTIYRR
ncbi:sodium:calcium antiporter [Aspergillus clavatus NRRL 1]|uniref:Sodium/calcium transporter, putative n=1 Tax=Aspergillus clavatus (strain ATCC 1007 / CBS 513.65 / DSM 816 / NCTC 3887 / NRRL 1 / QM 1276 / 107) TaxID=344612 RepID=A1CFW8_ASPCL|nr:sodium/calcium transporter, putative [Aspergillus clavatus NRRL 1]EAW11767.1 sodium/calcium transporter, putative [Aspergillus clavatus NRRL 1]